MSTRLTLLPFSPDAEWSHTLLGPIEPSQRLVGALEAIQAHYGRDVPLTFNTYLCVDDDDHPTHYGNTQQDEYGYPLKHVAISELMHLLESEGVTESWLADASWAYMAALPDGWRVALYWH
jgi:hypothetical protein